MRHDRGDVDVAGAQGPIHALSDAVAIAEPARPHLLGLRGVDILEVNVCDPIGCLPSELGRVGAADEQVTGVQAQRDRGTLQDSLHLGAVLDHRAHVWVEYRADAFVGGCAGHAIQVGQQRPPALLVELGTAVVALLTAD